MIFGPNKKKKEQDVIQAMLQAEDDAFHRTIVSLERLESHLLPSNLAYPQLKKTAAGSSRDYHDNSIPVADESMYYLELQLDCKGLYMCAHYDNPDVFKIAVESFLKDLLEWYGGRSLLEFYDAVDTAIIPLLTAITYKSNQIDELFEKYVYETPILSTDSTEGKYQAVSEGINAWLKGEHIYEHESKEATEFVTSHFRGSALDGYKRIIAALSHVCESSAPLKMFVKMVNEYLPSVSSQLPNITEAAIDKMYDRRNCPDESHVANTSFQQTTELFDIDFSPDNDVNINHHEEEVSEPIEKVVEEETAETATRSPKDEKYARILTLANEIIELVKSLEED